MCGAIPARIVAWTKRSCVADIGELDSGPQRRSGWKAPPNREQDPGPILQNLRDPMVVNTAGIRSQHNLEFIVDNYPARIAAHGLHAFGCAHPRRRLPFTRVREAAVRSFILFTGEYPYWIVENVISTAPHVHHRVSLIYQDGRKLFLGKPYASVMEEVMNLLDVFPID